MTTRKTRPTPKMSPKPEKWTWQMAEEALTKNIANRHLREAEVGKYARLMTDKLWGSPNAKPGYRAAVAPLVYDWDGNLIDGQHRLHAQVKAKTTEYYYVLRDVPTDTQLFIDNNIPRNPADALKYAGYGNYTTLQGVARWGWLLEQGQASNGRIKVASQEILDMLTRHPDLVHSGEIASYSQSSNFFKKLIGPTPVGAAHWWIAQTNDHAEADMFVDRMIRMSAEPEGSALWALWNRLSTANQKNERIPLRIKLAMMVRTWNLDVERVYVHRLPSKSRTGEYPVPDPVKRIESQEDVYGPIGAATDEPMVGAGEEGAE